jgi:hypothetical protein
MTLLLKMMFGLTDFVKLQSMAVGKTDTRCIQIHEMGYQNYVIGGVV